jgi:hypothetical protein
MREQKAGKLPVSVDNQHSVGTDGVVSTLAVIEKVKPTNRVFTCVKTRGFPLFSNRHLTRILDTIERRPGIVPGDKKDKK